MTWRLDPEDNADEETKDRRVHLVADASVADDRYFTASCKRDGCVDLWWGDDEYEHICDLAAKIDLLIDLYAKTFIYFQSRGGAEGWEDPYENAIWDVRAERVLAAHNLKKSGLILP